MPDNFIITVIPAIQHISLISYDHLFCHSPFFQREVLPYVPDAWIDDSATRTGYEISFTRYFYKPQALRPLSEIRADIIALEQETEGLLDQILKLGTE